MNKPHNVWLIELTSLVVIFALSCCLALFLTLYRRLFVVLSLTNFLLDTSLRAASLKTT